MTFKDSIIVGILLACFIFLFKASTDAGLNINYEWDGVAHHHNLRIK